jgi:6-phosphogluconate dehydrogenase
LKTILFISHLFLGEAVFARCLSSLKDERVNASKQLSGPSISFSGDKQKFIEQISHVSFRQRCFFLYLIIFFCRLKDHFVFQALYASKIISYAQGFMLFRDAAKQLNWKLNNGGIALMWRGGCIIRRSVNNYSEFMLPLHLSLFHF